MCGSLPLEVGFQQSFSFRPDFVDEVKQAAVDLTSKVDLFTN